MADRLNGTASRQNQHLDPAGEISDRRLLGRFLARAEEAAFAALVRRHGPMVIGICRRVLRDDHDAEDAFQATFLALARRAGAIRRHDSLAAWLYGVAYRQSVKARARAARKRTVERKAAPRAPDGPSEDLTWREVREALDEELSRLPDPCRAAFLLCYEQEHTQEEAARQLGWPRGTLKRRLERARELLRERLSRRGLALSASLVTLALTGAASAVVPEALVAATLQNSARLLPRRPPVVDSTGQVGDGTPPNGRGRPWTFGLSLLWLLLLAGILAPMGPGAVPPEVRAHGPAGGTQPAPRRAADTDRPAPDREKFRYTTDGFANSPMACLTS
jgi:RNA polymerase sigma factor (sigma-70 family)